MAVPLLLLVSASGSARTGELSEALEPAYRTPAIGGDEVAVVLTPRHEAVLCAGIAGRVAAIRKELGEPFVQDEPLLLFEAVLYQANKGIAEADLESARSHLARVQQLEQQRTRQRHAKAVLAAAQADLAMTQRLYDDGHASQLDLEKARRDVTVAETNCELVDSTCVEELTNVRRELAVATGKLEIASDQLAACTMKAPWPGRVKRVLVNEHEFVERGTPVIEVLDDRVLLARFLLPSAAFRSVHIGQELSLTVNEIAGRASMKVSHIAAALDAASVTFEVHAEIDNGGGNLRAGMNGSVLLSEIGAR